LHPSPGASTHTNPSGQGIPAIPPQNCPGGSASTVGAIKPATPNAQATNTIITSNTRELARMVNLLGENGGVERAMPDTGSASHAGLEDLTSNVARC
jgi:hypothetical protein